MNSRNLWTMLMLINYSQKRTNMNYSFCSATWLNNKNLQSMPHDFLNTNKCMDEQRIEYLQCVVWHARVFEPKTCVGLGESKVPFSDWKYKKCLPSLSTFYIQIYIFPRVCHFTNPVLKGTNIKWCMKRQLWRMRCL